LHIDTDSFVVTVDAGPVRGFASHARAAHRGEDRGDDLVAQGEQGGDGARGRGRDVVAAGSAGFIDEVFAPQLAQVVAGLADGAAAVIDTGEGVHLGGERGDGQPVGRWRQRQGGAQRVTHAGFVQVDTADPGGTQPDAGGQLIEDAVAEESRTSGVSAFVGAFFVAGVIGSGLVNLPGIQPATEISLRFLLSCGPLGVVSFFPRGERYS
jgi:hypothetical protein